MAVQTDIDVFRNARKVFTATPVGGAVNIAGWTLALVVRLTWDSPIKVIEATTVGGQITTPDAANGVIQIDLSADMTRQRPARYRYTLERTDAGSEDVLAYGDFLVRESYRA